MRKQISVGLVVAMCASLAVPVSAAEAKEYKVAMICAPAAVVDA